MIQVDWLMFGGNVLKGFALGIGFWLAYVLIIWLAYIPHALVAP